jgi:hypothetical protein
MARELLQAQDFECPLPGGGSKTFILSKFPAIVGREIIAKYPLSGMPKLGDYSVNEETMFKLMNHVAIRGANGEPIRLSTRDLIDNHCESWEVLARVEFEMLKLNCSFFADGRASRFLEGFAQKALASVTKMLMGSLEQLSSLEKQRSKNSEKTTR